MAAQERPALVAVRESQGPVDDRPGLGGHAEVPVEVGQRARQGGILGKEFGGLLERGLVCSRLGLCGSVLQRPAEEVIGGEERGASARGAVVQEAGDFREIGFLGVPRFPSWREGRASSRRRRASST